MKRLRKVSTLPEKKIFSQEKCKEIHLWEKKVKCSDKTWANIQGRHVITGKLGQSKERSRGVGTLQGSALPGHAQPLCSQGWKHTSPQMLTWRSEPWHKTSEGRHPVLLFTQHKNSGLCLLAFSYNELVCCLNAQLSAGHWLRCVLSPGKYFGAGGLQPIQTIILTEWLPSGRERRNLHDVAQQLLCAQGLQEFCLICCPSCCSALLSRIS